jgi:hypothetical protein
MNDPTCDKQIMSGPTCDKQMMNGPTCDKQMMNGPPGRLPQHNIVSQDSWGRKSYGLHNKQNGTLTTVCSTKKFQRMLQYESFLRTLYQYPAK